MTRPSTAFSSVSAFWGSANPIEAELFMQPADSSISLRGGHVSGPFCAGTHTLPADYMFHLCDQGHQNVLRAVLPDPCFWAPGCPYLYRAEVQFCLTEDSEQKTESLIVGIRPLTIHGVDLLYAGRRHVMRIVDMPPGIETEENREALLEACLQTGSALLLRQVHESTCDRATEKGVLLVIQVEETDPQRIVKHLERLSRWPSVGMVLLPPGLIFDVPTNPMIAPLIRAVAVDRNDQKVPPWAQVLILDEKNMQSDLHSEKKRPRMVYCSTESGATIMAARGCCDDLQRRTTTFPQIAGYIATFSDALY